MCCILMPDSLSNLGVRKGGTHPKRQKRGNLDPTMPLTTGPLCSPTRIWMGMVVTGLSTLQDSSSSVWMAGRQAGMTDRQVRQVSG